MTKDEALKLALKALEGMQNAIYNISGEHIEALNYAVKKANVAEQTITTIKEALAKPDQKPVAWITPDGEGFRIRFSPPVNDVPLGWDALYTTPPKRKPLTGERLSFEAYTIDPGGWNDLRLKFAWHKGFHEGARAIEAAHNIKE